MRDRTLCLCGIVVILGSIASGALAGTTTVEDLRREIAILRRSMSERGEGPIGRVDAITAEHCADGVVTTKYGKLTVGGLLQVWNYNIQNDHQDVFGDRGNFAGSGGTSEAIDNNGYMIRRARLSFTADVTENIQSYLSIDPALESASFPSFPSNQGIFKSQRENPSIALDTPIANTSVGRVQSGAGAPNRTILDAWFHVHGVVPHHDFTIGQFRPHMGEEGVRDPAYLDFAERAMVTQPNVRRDIGLQVHGTFVEERVQYWAGVFNSPGDLFASSGFPASRSDDNDEKDFVGSLLVRPIWNMETWGSLELGYSGRFGVHGESGDRSPDGSSPLNGLNRLHTASQAHYVWAMYKPLGVTRGWWVRGEYGDLKDRPVPLAINVFGLGSGPVGEQAAPNPFHLRGGYVSTGYKLSESLFAERLKGGGFWNKLMEPVEFAFRYETFQNILSEDFNSPDAHTDVFSTDVLTAGVNYYLHGYKARVQLNYLFVNEEENKVNQAARGFHEVRNNVLLLSYQVSF